MVVICLFGVSTVNSQIALTKALDYDGDRKTDFSVLRPKNNIWYISTSGGAFPSQQLGNSALYTPTPDVKLWMITEADRSSSTVLLPSEY